MNVLGQSFAPSLDVFEERVVDLKSASLTICIGRILIESAF